MGPSTAFDLFDDIDAQAQQLAGFDQEYQQLEPGPYAGAFLTTGAGAVSLAVERTNRALYQQGAGPAGVLSAVLLLRDGFRPSRVNGKPFTTDNVLLLGPGSSFEAVIEAGAVPAVLSTPANGLGDTLSTLADGQSGKARSVVDPQLARTFQSMARSVSEGAGDDTATMELGCGSLLLSALGSLPEHRGDGCIGTFRQATAVMMADPTAPLSIAGVARSVGVSRRTLDHTFQACVGVTPARFRKLVRLNHARRLIATERQSVTRAANLSGLHHLGRFSRDYRELFGELPSNALDRARTADSSAGAGR